MSTPIKLDPTITNFPIQICVKHGEELKVEADRLLARISENLLPDQWTKLDEDEIYRFQENVTLFGMLKKRAFGDDNLLIVAQEEEKTKLETLQKKVIEKTDAVNKRIRQLQNSGVPIANSFGIGGFAPWVLEEKIQSIYAQYAPAHAKLKPTESFHKVLTWIDQQAPWTLALSAIFCHAVIEQTPLLPFTDVLTHEIASLGYGALVPMTISLLKAPVDLFYGVENNSIAALPWRAATKTARTIWAWKREIAIGAICLLAGNFFTNGNPPLLPSRLKIR